MWFLAGDPYHVKISQNYKNLLRVWGKQLTEKKSKTSQMGVLIGARGMQTVPTKVSNALQCIYHEINSQLIFLNIKAEFGSVLK